MYLSLSCAVSDSLSSPRMTIDGACVWPRGIRLRKSVPLLQVKTRGPGGWILLSYFWRGRGYSGTERRAAYLWIRDGYFVINDFEASSSSSSSSSSFSSSYFILSSEVRETREGRSSRRFLREPRRKSSSIFSTKRDFLASRDTKRGTKKYNGMQCSNVAII